ncbi:MAG: aminoacyl-tRNA hydrolase [Bacteroidota bacterium]
MKYLIAGLGNIGDEYTNTRHNIGFTVLDTWAREAQVAFEPGRHAAVAEVRLKGRTFVLIKPTTYMNLSGKAVNYWMQQAKIPLANLLVVTDDLALPFGKIRLRAKGSDGGHNGLKHIQQVLGSTQYARLRFGIGSDFSSGQQVRYVLDAWSAEEQEQLSDRIAVAVDTVKAFGTIGVHRAMSAFNNK